MCPACVDESAGEVERVLVIDDEPSVADALRMIMEDEGFAVVVAASGREGLEQARRARFRVTITDLRLPDMDGLEVLGAFREGGVGGSVILITSYGTPEILARARDLGAVGVIAKPFLPSEILKLVAAALGRREACDP
ncbi:MAG TPA: response regulator [Pyrinomonadaceae bacterium]|nr:response regulator [Pyrinomonadaceae bacterium]